MDKSQRGDHSTLAAKRADLKRRLEFLAYNSGGDLFGVADLEPAHEFIVTQGGEALGKFPPCGLCVAKCPVGGHT